jgi:heterodisulfide reductase subunit B
MTAYSMWNLSCEFEGEVCSASLDNTCGASAQEARKFAREEGWVRRRVNGVLVDLCRFHADPEAAKANAFAGTQSPAAIQARLDAEFYRDAAADELACDLSRELEREEEC